jgi:hypothetical protein
MEQEIQALLRRALVVLRGYEGPRQNGAVVGKFEGAEVLGLSRTVFYELGIASTENGPIARASLRFEGPNASPRAFRVAVYGDGGRLALAVRWLPQEARPHVVRGEAKAADWNKTDFEGEIEQQLRDGVERFEQDIAEGRGLHESSGDQLGLGG